MRYKDFFILPTGKYKLTDGNWDFVLEKVRINTPGNYMYTLTELLTGNRVSFFHRDELVKPDKAYTRMVLYGISNVGGLSMWCKELKQPLSKLNLIPNSTYLKTFSHQL